MDLQTYQYLARIWSDATSGNEKIATDVAAILSAGGAIDADWTNGGRLDLILDQAAADAAANLVLLSSGGAIYDNLAAALADTNELQTDWTNGGRLDLILDDILADSNELQTDWANGGRLDLILDQAAADAAALLVLNQAGGAIYDAVVTDIPADIATVDANVDTILARETVVTNTVTCTAQGGGAGKVVDLFTLTGTVEITAIYGEVMEATDSTKLDNLLLHLFPAGGAGVDITATGTDYSGIAVGEILRSITSAATALERINIAAAIVNNTGFLYSLLAKQTAVVSTIQAEYESDANTDVDIKWTIRYRPISTDGALVAV